MCDSCMAWLFGGLFWANASLRYQKRFYSNTQLSAKYNVKANTITRYKDNE